MHIHQEPPSGGTSLGALEGDINVILSAAMMQRQPNPGVDSLVIMGRGVEVPEPHGIWSKPEPTFAQHGEAAERNDGVRVHVYQLTPEKVHDSNEELAGRKAKPSN
jgi:hypothetical protein